MAGPEGFAPIPKPSPERGLSKKTEKSSRPEGKNKRAEAREAQHPRGEASRDVGHALIGHEVKRSEAPKIERKRGEHADGLFERPKRPEVAEDQPKASLRENAPAPEAEAPHDRIGTAEKPVIQREIAQELQAKVAEKQVDPNVDPETALGDKMTIDMYEAAKTMPLEDAAEVAMRANNIDPTVIDEVPEVPPRVETFDDDEEDESDGKIEVGSEVENEAESEVDEPSHEIVVEHAVEIEPPVVEAEDEAEPEDPSAVTPTSSVGAGSGSGGATGGSATPPAGGGGPGSAGSGGPGGPGGPPLPPNGPPTPSFGPPPMPGSNPNAFYVAPAQSHQGRERDDPNRNIDDGNTIGTALVAGIVGYLIGRRRGRIKTEKRLLPVQKKLEKQVDDLQWDLKRQELRLRHIAAAQVRYDKPGVMANLFGSPRQPIKPYGYTETAPQPEQSPAAQASVESTVPLINVLQEQPNKKPERNNEAIERQRAPEAHQLHGETNASEHIGHMLMAVESIADKRAEREERKLEQHSEQMSAATHEAIERDTEQVKEARRAERRAIIQQIEKAEVAGPDGKTVTIEQRVETMPRAELIILSEKIVVEGSSLRQIYETRLVGENGLRRLVAEYQRGGDMQRALRREIIEREIDFERDPIMRDVDTANKDTGKNGEAVEEETKKEPATPAMTLQQMVERAAERVDGTPAEEVAYYKAQAASEAEQRKQQEKQHRVMDVILGLVIISLTAVVAVMYVIHG